MAAVEDKSLIQVTWLQVHDRYIVRACFVKCSGVHLENQLFGRSSNIGDPVVRLSYDYVIASSGGSE